MEGAVSYISKNAVERRAIEILCFLFSYSNSVNPILAPKLLDTVMFHERFHVLFSQSPLLIWYIHTVTQPTELPSILESIIVWVHGITVSRSAPAFL